MTSCIVITGLGTGGAEKTLLQVVPELTNDSFIVSLTDDDDIGKQIEAKGVDVYYLGLHKSLLNLPAVIWRFTSILRERRPQRVVSFLIHSHLFTRLLAPLFADEYMCSIQLKHQPSILTWFEYVTNGLVDRYIPNSPALEPWLHRRGVSSDNITMIPNGVDIERYNPDVDIAEKKQSIGLAHDDFVVGSVGRLNPQKRFPDLIEAVNGLDVELIIAGEGERRQALTEQAERLGCTDQLHLLGNRDDVPELLQIMDIFCLPSENEGMSNALLEAMAAGRCCAVSDIQENTELITNDRGAMFTKGNSDDLRSTIKGLQNDDEQRQVYGRKAKQHIEDHHSLQNTISQFKAILDD